MASNCVWNWSVGVACFETAIGRQNGRRRRSDMERKMKERAGKKKTAERKERRKEGKAESSDNGRRKRGVNGNRKKWKALKN